MTSCMGQYTRPVSNIHAPYGPALLIIDFAQMYPARSAGMASCMRQHPFVPSEPHLFLTVQKP